MDMLTNNLGPIFLILGVLWLIQFGLAYRQMRHFYQRMITLRQSGLTAIGLAGNRYKGRAYAVLTIDEDDRIIYAEQFSGWTVFAQLRPMPQLIGMSLQELLNNEASLPISKKLRPAFGNAARDLQAARGQGKISTFSQANLGIV